MAMVGTGSADQAAPLRSRLEPVHDIGPRVDPRRSVPRTDVVMADPRLREAAGRLGVRLVKIAVASAQDVCRQGRLDPVDVADAALAALPAAATSMRRVVNATGVVVHTNLGRAPLSGAALDALSVAGGTTDVELDLESGVRGRRGRGALEALSAAVPESESCLVVNNGAAALAVVAAALAGGRDIIVARGELVEIGDGFRIPELLEAAGARLREVGTTNRVRLSDYLDAVGPGSALVLKVHPSNFVVEGFTSSVRVEELADLPLPLVVDIGSGLLDRHARLPNEPSARGTLRAGADLVTASGDKLLGGPQCGLLFGRNDLVERVQRHPMARAVRVDKLTLAALEATLRGPRPPVVAALHRDPDELWRRAEQVCAAIQAAGPARPVDANAVRTRATVGGGGAPGVRLDSAAVSLPSAYSHPLRSGNPAVLGHVRAGRLLLDLVAVEEAEDAVLVEAVCRTAADQNLASG